MPVRHRYLVAFEVPGRAAVEIDGLRRALSTPQLARIPAHLTLVPPANVRGEVEPIVEFLHEQAATTAPLDVVLGPPASFAPRSSILYLKVTGNLVALESLQVRLMSGPLGMPNTRDFREFVPHVTIANRLDVGEVSAALNLLAGYRTQVTFTHITLYEQQLQTRERRWRSVADVALGRPTVVGRGGRELTFHLGELLDPASEEFFGREWGSYVEETYGRDFEQDSHFTLSAWSQGKVVAVASGTFISDHCELDRLIVAAAERGTGIGGQLLARLEQAARERGSKRVRLRAAADGPAEGFYLRHGYQRTTTLLDWRGGRDFVVLEREL